MTYAPEYFGGGEYTGPTAEEIATAVLAAATATPIHSHLKIVNGVTLDADSLFDEDDLIETPIDARVTETTSDGAAGVLSAMNANPPRVVAVNGTGEKKIVVTVRDAESNTVPGARVNLLNSDGDITGVVATTNTQGVATLYADDGEYQLLVSQVLGFESHTPQSLTVDGEETTLLTISATSNATFPAASPGL